MRTSLGFGVHGVGIRDGEPHGANIPFARMRIIVLYETLYNMEISLSSIEMSANRLTKAVRTNNVDYLMLAI